MSTVREVLNEVKERRLHDDRVFALRSPWYSPFRPLLSQLPWLAMTVWTLERSVPLSTWQIVLTVVAAGFGLADVVLAVRARERLWREVVRREAPDLYAKLSNPMS